jgi:D-alanyl-D-alanine dipeptidase
MISAGFTNLPSEWWHYDYGTKFWAYFTGNKALYKGIRKINTSLWG